MDKHFIKLLNSTRGMVIVEPYDKTFALLVTEDVLISPDFETKRQCITVPVFFSKHLKGYVI